MRRPEKGEVEMMQMHYRNRVFKVDLLYQPAKKQWRCVFKGEDGWDTGTPWCDSPGDAFDAVEKQTEVKP